MTIDLSGLQDLRTGVEQKADESAFKPLDLADLHPGTLLACDQSVTAMGVVLFEVSPEGRCAVHMSTTLGEPNYVGFHGLLDHVERLEERLSTFVNHYAISNDDMSQWGHIRAVHEGVPPAKGKMARPEVSLLSAYAWRRVTRNLERLDPIGRQVHARLLCGNGNVKKKSEYHGPLKELFPQIRGAEDWVTNEATRDALCIALAAAHRGYGN